MLFKNLRTGNLVKPKDPATAEMMVRSGSYEAVTAKAAVSVPKAPKLTKKTGKKPSE